MLDGFVSALSQYGGDYLRGMAATIELTALSLAAGFVLAWPLAVVRARRGPWWLSVPARGFTWFMTGTPMLVQLFLVYYGLAQFAAVRESFAWSFLREPYWCALIVFSLNTAAYSAEIFRGALEGENRGETEAALSCGVRPWRALLFLRIPSAFRRALPAYGNEMIFLLHGSAIASVVTILDLTGAARVAARGTFAFTESYLIALVLYMLIAGTIVLFVRLLERRLLRHLRPATAGAGGVGGAA